ncbi:MAG: DUF72 domain-containing protein, partial [Actinomycetota bacterium]
MTVFIGTSGWQYRDWRERFYPKEVPQRLWLEHYAEQFVTVESNNAFYRLPERDTFAAWARRTPDDFVMASKMSRFLTHLKRLREPEEPVARFLDRAEGLGPKLGPVLLQLPPNLKADLDALDLTLRQFPARVRVAVEFRHETWVTDETRALLEKRGAALCLADRLSRPVSALWRTADWTYVRLHEGAATPHPCYGRSALKTWAERLAEEWGDNEHAWVFFNNDPGGCAVRDARYFAREVERAGLTPTRVPADPIEV